VNDAKPSKSARKRDQLALQSLGEKLIPLELEELEQLPLDEPLLEAIVHAKSIRSRSASRRQRQLIGKLMREADAGCIQSSLDRLGQQDRLTKATFRAAEQWRDRLLAEGASALSEFSAHAGTPETNLAELLRECDAARSEQAQRGIRRRIFREVYKGLAGSKETKEQ
jgi:ribosome-associated protein